MRTSSSIILSFTLVMGAIGLLATLVLSLLSWQIFGDPAPFEVWLLLWVPVMVALWKYRHDIKEVL